MATTMTRVAGLASMVGGVLWAIIWSLGWWADDYLGVLQPHGQRERILGLTADDYMRWFIIPIVLVAVGLGGIHIRQARYGRRLFLRLVGHFVFLLACLAFGGLVFLHVYIYWWGHDVFYSLAPLIYILPVWFLVTISLILYGLATLAVRVLPPPWRVVPLGLGVVYGVSLFSGGFFSGLADSPWAPVALAAPVVFGLGWAWLGYLLWSEPAGLSPHPQGRMTAPMPSRMLAIGGAFAVIWLSVGVVSWSPRSIASVMERTTATPVPTIPPLPPAGEGLISWGSKGSDDGQFSLIPGAALAADGSIYVADRDNQRIQHFSRTGVFQGKWSLPAKPTAIAIARDDTVLVSDSSSHVHRFTPGGERLGGWGAPGTGDGQFSHPGPLAVAPDDTVYVVDRSATDIRIQRFTATGEFLGKWGSPGTNPGQFQGCGGIAVGADGTVYVADEIRRVQRFSATGEFLREWGSSGGGNGQFFLISEVVVASDGSIWVLDSSRIQRFSPEGEFVQVVKRWSASNLYQGMLIAPDRALYLVSSERSRIDFWPDAMR